MDIGQVHQNLKPEVTDFEHIFEVAPVGMLLVYLPADAQPQVVRANRLFAGMLGKDSMALAGKGLKELLAPEDHERLDECLRSGARHLRFELSFTGRSSERVVCQVALSPLGPAAPGAFILSADDITSKKAAEAQMLTTIGLEQREDFIATLTHDLKTPIVGANMVLTALLDGTLGALSEQQSHIVNKLKTSNQALLKMIHNLLEVYRYESGTESLSVEEVDLVTVVKRCADEVRPLIENKSQRLEFQFAKSSMDLVCDEHAIQRVLINLIGNAVKFTPEKGLITVMVDDNADSVCIKVTDTGSGISAQDQPRLFQRFWQGEPGRRYAAGTGLGLYFCNHVIRAHGGSIQCESAPGVGSTFTVDIPKRR